MQPYKILVVDDDPDVQLGLHVRLKANQYATCFASDGAMAISAARREQPDLIILDLGLPAADGFEVLNRLRQSVHLSVIPVIILSCRDRSSNQERARASGASVYFQKPVDNEELMATIRDLIGQPPQPEKRFISGLNSDPSTYS